MVTTPLLSSLCIDYLSPAAHPHERLGADIIAGLSQSPKTLSPQYFYDEYGSILFEKICQQPEYYPTRTEASILRHSAHAIAQQTGQCELVELGSGSSTKTRYLLTAYESLGRPFRYVPVDVSGEMLTQSAHQLRKEYPSLDLYGLVGTYELALDALQQKRVTKLPRMMIFLGSTLGNFAPEQSDRFFAQVSESLRPGDYFLLGVDLQKSTDILTAAYNDVQGVTAAFNLNMLTHLNRRFGSNFAVDAFSHRAIYNETDGQIEMYLDCHQTHTVHFVELDFTVECAAGEALRTEISRKFAIAPLQAYLTAQGLKPQNYWTDANHWFALVLAQRV